MKMRLGRWKWLGVVGCGWRHPPPLDSGFRRNDEFGGGNHSSRIGVRDMLSYQSLMPAGAGTPGYENWVHLLMEGSGVVCARHPTPSWGQAPALHLSFGSRREPFHPHLNPLPSRERKKTRCSWITQFAPVIIGRLDDHTRRVVHTPTKVLPMSPVPSRTSSPPLDSGPCRNQECGCRGAGILAGVMGTCFDCDESGD